MRTIKTLGLVAVTALALTAIGAASASASGFVAPTYPAHVSGEGAGGELVFKFGSSVVYGCSTPKAGSNNDQTGPSRELSMWFVEKTCTMEPSGTEAVMNPNGCSVIYHVGSETSAGHFGGSFDIGGKSCTGVTLTRTSGVCTITIPPQKNLAASFENESKASPAYLIAKQQAVGGVKYSDVGTGAGCPTPGAHEDGQLLDKHALKALTAGGVPESYTADANAPLGLFTESGQFKGESYPLPVGGDQVSAFKFSASGYGTQQCASTHFGTLLTAASASLSPVSAEAAGCSVSVPLIGTFNATVQMESCHYVFNAGGTMGIACGASPMKIINYNTNGTVRCAMSISTQEGLSGMTVTNGSGPGRGVILSFAVSGVTYKTENSLASCGVSQGTHSNGSFSGSVSLLGGQA